MTRVVFIFLEIDMMRLSLSSSLVALALIGCGDSSGPGLSLTLSDGSHLELSVTEVAVEGEGRRLFRLEPLDDRSEQWTLDYVLNRSAQVLDLSVGHEVQDVGYAYSSANLAYDEAYARSVEHGQPVRIYWVENDEVAFAIVANAELITGGELRLDPRETSALKGGSACSINCGSSNCSAACANGTAECYCDPMHCGCSGATQQ